MSIRRAIPNVASDDLDASREFYAGFLGFDVAMEEDGLLMFASPSNRTAQVIVHTSGETAYDPDIRRITMSLEVGDVDAAYAEAQRRGLAIVRPIADEPWGIRRFFVADPSGAIINVTAHIA
jgi:catechol 2,3-dioxygenase-like lactoylglutathione lyase family enzyme